MRSYRTSSTVRVSVPPGAWRTTSSSSAALMNARQGGGPTDVVAVEIDFICADDAHHSLCPRGIRIAHGGSKERPCRPLPRSWSFRIYHLRGFDSLCQEANAPLD